MTGTGGEAGGGRRPAAGAARLSCALLALCAGCATGGWTADEREIALQECRSQIGLGPVNLFTRHGPAHAAEECLCKVEVLSGRIPWRKFSDGAHPVEVALAMDAAVTTCARRLESAAR